MSKPLYPLKIVRAGRAALLMAASALLSCGEDASLEPVSGEEALSVIQQAVHNGTPDLDKRYHATVHVGGCTGTIFKQDGEIAWILTAAHCVNTVPGSAARQWRERPVSNPFGSIQVGVSSGVYATQCVAYNQANPQAPILPCVPEASYPVTGIWRNTWPLPLDNRIRDYAILRIQVPPGVTLPVMPMWTQTQNDPEAGYLPTAPPYMMAGFGRQDYWNVRANPQAPPAPQPFPLTNDGRRHYGAHPTGGIGYINDVGAAASVGTASRFTYAHVNSGMASTQKGDSGGPLIMRKGCQDYVVGATSTLVIAPPFANVVYASARLFYLEELTQEPLASLVGDLTEPDPVAPCGEGKLTIRPRVSFQGFEQGSLDAIQPGFFFYEVAPYGKSRVAPLHAAIDPSTGAMSGVLLQPQQPLQERSIYLPTRGERYTVTLDPLVWRRGDEVRYLVARPVSTGPLYLKNNEEHVLHVTYEPLLMDDTFEQPSKPGMRLLGARIVEHVAQGQDDVFTLYRMPYTEATVEVDGHTLAPTGAHASRRRDYELVVQSKLTGKVRGLFKVPAAYRWEGGADQDPLLKVDGDVAIVCVTHLYCHLFGQTRPTYGWSTLDKTWHYMGPWHLASQVGAPYVDSRAAVVASVDILQRGVEPQGSPRFEVAVAQAPGFASFGAIYLTGGRNPVASLPKMSAEVSSLAQELFLRPSTVGNRSAVSMNPWMMMWSSYAPTANQGTVVAVNRLLIHAPGQPTCYAAPSSTLIHPSCVQPLVGTQHTIEQRAAGRSLLLSRGLKKLAGQYYALGLVQTDTNLLGFTVESNASQLTAPQVSLSYDMRALLAGVPGGLTSQLGRGYAMGPVQLSSPSSAASMSRVEVMVGDPGHEHGRAWAVTLPVVGAPANALSFEALTPSADTVNYSSSVKAQFGARMSLGSHRYISAPYQATLSNGGGHGYYSKVYAYSPNQVCVPSAEVCDGLDNDCDGQVDEGVVCGPPACVPTPEVCDGVDNDCDGLIDEGRVCGPIVICPNLGYEVCANGVDDDCDGLIDEQPCLFDAL